ncbi:hornerin-like [Coregonus clupeaformis]|uniref:hornerin-like n=1 Tax=Coregonus clupeaformis TaxID=59861 RepID=UPI001E1C3853|nr:hornerin-like [Coregonus clupeaformis]
MTQASQQDTRQLIHQATGVSRSTRQQAGSPAVTGVTRQRDHQQQSIRHSHYKGAGTNSGSDSREPPGTSRSPVQRGGGAHQQHSGSPGKAAGITSHSGDPPGAARAGATWAAQQAHQQHSRAHQAGSRSTGEPPGSTAGTPGVKVTDGGSSGAHRGVQQGVLTKAGSTEQQGHQAVPQATAVEQQGPTRQCQSSPGSTGDWVVKSQAGHQAAHRIHQAERSPRQRSPGSAAVEPYNEGATRQRQSKNYQAADSHQARTTEEHSILTAGGRASPRQQQFTRQGSTQSPPGKEVTQEPGKALSFTRQGQQACSAAGTRGAERSHQAQERATRSTQGPGNSITAGSHRGTASHTGSTAGSPGSNRGSVVTSSQQRSPTRAWQDHQAVQQGAHLAAQPGSHQGGRGSHQAVMCSPARDSKGTGHGSHQAAQQSPHTQGQVQGCGHQAAESGAHRHSRAPPGSGAGTHSVDRDHQCSAAGTHQAAERSSPKAAQQGATRQDSRELTRTQTPGGLTRQVSPAAEVGRPGAAHQQRQQAHQAAQQVVTRQCSRSHQEWQVATRAQGTTRSH